jgi:hypothetical protein
MQTTMTGLVELAPSSRMLQTERNSDMLRRVFPGRSMNHLLDVKCLWLNGPRTYPTVAHVLTCWAEAWYRVVRHGVMDEILLPPSGNTGTGCRRNGMLFAPDRREFRGVSNPRVIVSTRIGYAYRSISYVRRRSLARPSESSAGSDVEDVCSFRARVSSSEHLRIPLPASLAAYMLPPSSRHLNIQWYYSATICITARRVHPLRHPAGREMSCCRWSTLGSQ